MAQVILMQYVRELNNIIIKLRIFNIFTVATVVKSFIFE